MNEQEKNEKLEKVIDITMKDKLTPEDKQFTLNELNEIIKEYPNDIDALFWLGLHYQGERDFETAISYYEKILEIAPNDSNSENVQNLIKDCTEFIKFDKEFKEYESGKTTENFLDKAPDLLTKLSPKWLVIIKIIIILVFFLVYAK